MIRYGYNYWVPCIAILLGLCMLFGCSDNFPESKTRDVNSGAYQLSGTQVEKHYQFPWGEDNVYSRDTTEIEFMVTVEYPHEREDTVRFEGLEGANAGEYHSVNSNCTHPSCYADAQLISEELKFNLSAAGGSYTGEGFLGAGTLILETHFRYRGIGIDYYLQGEKVQE